MTAPIPIIDTLRALATTLKNALRKPTTYEFPKVIRPRAERIRASFALPDDEHGEIACIACLACERICPSQVIKMKSGGKRDSPVTGKKRAYVDEFTLDLSACIQCELCVQVCNSDAIYMVREMETPAFSREDLVLTIDKLRANAKNKTASWGRGTILQEGQEPPKAEKKPAPAVKPADGPQKAVADAAPKPADAAPKPAEAPEKPAEAPKKPAEAPKKPAEGAPTASDGPKKTADGPKAAEEEKKPAAAKETVP